MEPAKSVVQKKKTILKVPDKIKEGIENYRAATDAPAKVDVYDVIEKVFENINPQLTDAGKISIDEVSGCLRNAYYDRKEPAERTHKQMISKIIQEGSLKRLARPAEGEIEAGPNLKLVGSADRVEDDVVMIFKDVRELPEMPFAEHFIRLNACLYLFNKEEGMLVYFDKEGNEMEFIVPKSKRLLNETLRRARILNTMLNNNVVPALEPSERCQTCAYYEKCYYRSEDKQNWGFWARGKWRELKPKATIL
ncbi:MAG: Dna2/Cas4 domain-containing protein [Thaumarchaeota archaeon]|nr:MAG: Dna2/Cas4 domain-containing protein [Nitrososphaerota archaeon]